jgi:hypothetical protein
VGKKAAKKSTTSRGKAVIAVDVAFQQRLARGEEPYEAVEALNAAILVQQILLFIEGREEPVEPGWFAGHARVAIRLVGGRATAEVVKFGRGFDGGPYKWTVSNSGMKSDILQRRPTGPRPTENWPEHIRNEIIRALNKGKPIPSAPELAEFCSKSLGYTPDVSAINKLIKDILANSP